MKWMGSNNYYTFVIAISGYLGRQGNWRIHKVGLKNSVVQLSISAEIAYKWKSNEQERITFYKCMCVELGNKGLQLNTSTSFQNYKLKSVHNLVMSDYNYVAVMLYFSSKVAQTI